MARLAINTMPAFGGLAGWPWQNHPAGSSGALAAATLGSEMKSASAQ
jgi:hypothetical protein